jgi:hypothetical protein
MRKYKSVFKEGRLASGYTGLDSLVNFFKANVTDFRTASGYGSGVSIVFKANGQESEEVELSVKLLQDLAKSKSIAERLFK